MIGSMFNNGCYGGGYYGGGHYRSVCYDRHYYHRHHYRRHYYRYSNTDMLSHLARCLHGGGPAFSFADCGSPLMVIGLLEAGHVVLRYALRIL